MGKRVDGSRAQSMGQIQPQRRRGRVSKQVKMDTKKIETAAGIINQKLQKVEVRQRAQSNVIKPQAARREIESKMNEIETLLKSGLVKSPKLTEALGAIKTTKEALKVTIMGRGDDSLTNYVKEIESFLAEMNNYVR